MTAAAVILSGSTKNKWATTELPILTARSIRIIFY